MPVSFVTKGKVAVLEMSNPPVNALSLRHGLVSALRERLEQAIGDDTVEAIVIKGAGRMFCGGADLADFDDGPEAGDQIRSLLTDIVEASPKPVIAAIHGVALGGGLELALAAHYRICMSDAKFALPEVTLGLLPGAGGTQRLPRLVGSDRALELMVSGRQFHAAEALKCGVVDEIADGDLTEAALAMANAAIGQPIRRLSALIASALSPSAAAKQKMTLSAAPAFITRCVDAAATLPFSEAAALEAKLFDDLSQSDASKGLRHVFFGRRQVSRAAQHIAPAPVTGAAIVGAGLMGSGIALAILSADIPVVLIDHRAEALAKALASVSKTIERDIEKGRVSPEIGQRRIALLKTSTDIADIGEAGLVIEAVLEDLDVKRAVFRDIENAARPDAVLATNTSTLDINKIADSLQFSDRFLGLHFFSPAHIMKLVEIVRGRSTSDQTLATAMGVVGRIGKVGVVSGVCDGFIGNRMFEEMLRQAYFLLEDGALPAQIDSALEAWGMAMGPLKVMDLAGQDIGWSIRKRRKIEQPQRPYSEIPDLLCELGRFGQKTRAGYYDYADGRTAQISPDVERMIVDFSARNGIARRTISDREIVERCIFAPVNEGTKILEEGIAAGPVDIDMVWVFGYGFPAERGGPMFYAQTVGFAPVLERVNAFHAGRNGWAWAPSEKLLDLAHSANTKTRKTA